MRPGMKVLKALDGVYDLNGMREVPVPYNDDVRKKLSEVIERSSGLNDLRKAVRKFLRDIRDEYDSEFVDQLRKAVKK